MTRRRLDHDQIWRLDHSRRRFRARPSAPGDHLALETSAVTIPCITIVRLRDGCKKILMRDRLPPLADTDEYAAEQWGALPAFLLTMGGRE